MYLLLFMLLTCVTETMEFSGLYQEFAESDGVPQLRGHKRFCGNGRKEIEEGTIAVYVEFFNLISCRCKYEERLS